MSEAYTTLPNTLRFYGKVENGEVSVYGAHIPFNFELISKTSMGTTAYEYKAHIEHWLEGMPKGNKIHANWVVRVLNGSKLEFYKLTQLLMNKKTRFLFISFNQKTCAAWESRQQTIGFTI